MAQQVLRLPQVIERTGLGRSSIYAGVKTGSFPAPIPIGPRARGWLASEVDEFIAARVAARGVVSAETGNGNG